VVDVSLNQPLQPPGQLRDRRAEVGRRRLVLLRWCLALAGTAAVFCLLLGTTLLKLGLG
jgi:hypothetical protein